MLTCFELNPVLFQFSLIIVFYNGSIRNKNIVTTLLTSMAAPTPLSPAPSITNLLDIIQFISSLKWFSAARIKGWFFASLVFHTAPQSLSVTVFPRNWNFRSVVFQPVSE
jgi:hypothetical protein